MSVIKWRESFNTGVDQFDEEHKKIVDLIQRLFDALKTGQKDDCATIIDELTSYTEYHFSNEEKVMTEVGYPGLEEHCQEHRDLIAQAASFQELGESMSREQLGEFYQFLRDWLVNHIIGCDKKYGEYIQEKSNN